MLDAGQAAHFKTHGYLVLEDFKSAQELAAVKKAAGAIMEAFDAKANRAIFTTGAPAEALDDYFLTSGDKVRCFVEENAFDERGELVREKALSINKIGHALHDIDPVFDEFSRDPRLAALLGDLGLMEPEIWQSMYICKQAHIGGEVGWHQDASYLFTEPQSVKTLWFAVDDATLDNGCLWVANCGARSPLREVFRVIDGRAATVELDATPWPALEDAVPLQVCAGTLVCFDGLLPHYSAANVSARPRHAYTLHVVDGRAYYPASNWIQRDSDFPVRGFTE